MVANEHWFGSAGAHEIDQSCRFNIADSAYMTRTPAGAGNTKTGTISFWVKRCKLGADQQLFHARKTSGSSQIRFSADDTLYFRLEDTGGNQQGQVTTNRLFRDVGSWYHIVCNWDTTDSTAGDRMKIFVNGVEETSFSADVNPAEDDTQTFFDTGAHYVGSTHGPADYLGAYLAEIYIIDGTAYAASSFGETSSTTGQWIPKSVSGLTFGTNGAYFDFADSSNLGNDANGGTDWTESGLAANDQLSDSPTNNFSTWNPLQKNADATLSDGNLKATPEGSNQQDTMVSSTIVVPSGSKMYAEFAVTNATTGMVGIQKENEWGVDWDAMAADSMRILHIATGDVFNANDAVSISNYAPNDSVPVTHMVAVDLVNDNMYIGDASTDKWSDGSGSYDQDFDESPGAISLTANLNWKFVIRLYNATIVANFGQSSFTGTKPTGYNAVSTANLPDTKITTPAHYFQSTIFTGTGSSLAVDQVGARTFEPDLVWIKNRDATDNHQLFDSARGVTKVLNSEDTDAEATDADTLTSFDSDGFTVGADVKVNTSTEKYVAWQWLESSTAGFDIGTGTGGGAQTAVSHSLGVVPNLIVWKSRDATSSWFVWSDTFSDLNDNTLFLHTNAATATSGFGSLYGTQTSSQTSILTSGVTGGIATGDDFVVYAWAEVEGFSKFGKYAGNANTDGPLVHCGFKPAFLMVKQANAVEGWLMFTSTIDTYNVVGDYLFADVNNAEYNSAYVDFLSNGFKVRINGSGMNGSTSDTHLFMAWAETPFKTANAR